MPGELAEGDARPCAALLCNSHVSDIIDPESYAGDVSMQYMQRRCVVRSACPSAKCGRSTYGAGNFILSGQTLTGPLSIGALDATASC